MWWYFWMISQELACFVIKDACSMHQPSRSVMVFTFTRDVAHGVSWIRKMSDLLRVTFDEEEACLSLFERFIGTFEGLQTGKKQSPDNTTVGRSFIPLSFYLVKATNKSARARIICQVERQRANNILFVCCLPNSQTHKTFLTKQTLGSSVARDKPKNKSEI